MSYIFTGASEEGCTFINSLNKETLILSNDEYWNSLAAIEEKARQSITGRKEIIC